MGGKRYRIRTVYLPKRLQEKLKWIEDFPVTLVEAPSGYGKTTALKYFFDNKRFSSVPVHWLTFFGESEQASWNAFSEVIMQVDRHCGEALKGLGGLSRDSLRQVENILSRISCPAETYIILDNVNQASFSDAVCLLEVLAGHGGEHLHIMVVTTQVTGQLHTVAGGSRMIYHLMPNDFAFTPADTAAYFKQVGVGLNAEQIKSVWESTDGWAFAIYLQMLAFLQTGNFSSGDMGVLIERSLWQHIDGKAQKCYLALSVLSGFTMEQALYLTDCSRNEAEDVLLGNGFLHFDEQTNTFHIHIIFSEFLHQRFKELPPDEKRRIWVRAGCWAEEHGERAQALQFYYEAGEFERIFAMATTSYELADIVDDNTRHIILGLLQNTPREVKVRYPRAMISIALTLFFLGMNEELIHRASEIEQIIEDSTIAVKEKDALHGEMELLLSFLEYNQIDAMSRRHRRSLELLRGPAKLINIRSTWTFGSPSVLHMFWRESGKLAEELDDMDRCMPVYYRLTSGHGNGAEHMMRAEALFLSGELENAEILCHKTLSIAEDSHQSSICQCALFLLARIALLRGEEEPFLHTVARMEEQSRQHTEDLCRFTLDLAKGFLGLLIGKEEWLSSWLISGDCGKRFAIMTVPFAHIIHGRALLERKAFRQILGVGEAFMNVASIFPNMLPQVYILIYMALASEETGRTGQAEKLLEQALQIALPDKVYMPFAENGAELEDLLKRVKIGKEDQDMLSRLTRQFQQGRKAFFLGDSLLTDRERQVALLAKERLSAKEIAQRLYISRSTVNNTLARVYEKLDIHSRAELTKKIF